MGWPTWDQAAIAAALGWGLAFLLRRRSTAARLAAVGPAASEFALIAALYSIWRIARKLPLARDEGAIERAYQIVDLQRTLRLPEEVALLDFVARHDWLAWASSAYYAGLHVPGLVAFLIWLYWRHRDVFPRWRNGLAIVTAGCLIVRFVRVAPPRMLPELGYYDLTALHGFDLYGPVGTGVSDQFAAMPSIHVAWAAVVSFGVIAASTSRWRWVFGLHLIITFLVVSATGNHWWLDGVAAVAILVAGLWLDSALRPRLRPRTLGDFGERVAEIPQSSGG